MGWGQGELRVSEEIAASSTVADTYTPLTSVLELWVCKAEGEAPGTPNSVVKVVWKWNHATESEVIIWPTKHSGKMSDEVEIPSAEIDGVRKLAIVCENGEDGDVVMFGKLCYKERT